MKKLFFVIIFSLSFSGFAQEVQNDSIYNISEVDKKPEFNGGVNKFNRFIGSNFRSGEQKKFMAKL